MFLLVSHYPDFLIRSRIHAFENYVQSIVLYSLSWRHHFATWSFDILVAQFYPEQPQLRPQKGVLINEPEEEDEMPVSETSASTSPWDRAFLVTPKLGHFAAARRRPTRRSSKLTYISSWVNVYEHLRYKTWRIFSMLLSVF